MYSAKTAAIIFTIYEFSTLTAIFYTIIHCIYIYLVYIYTLDLRGYYYLYILSLSVILRTLVFKL